MKTTYHHPMTPCLSRDSRFWGGWGLFQLKIEISKNLLRDANACQLIKKSQLQLTFDLRWHLSGIWMGLKWLFDGNGPTEVSGKTDSLCLLNTLASIGNKKKRVWASKRITLFVFAFIDHRIVLIHTWTALPTQVLRLRIN